MDHVRTQAPYALVTASVAIGCGYLPSLFVPQWGFGLALGSGVAVIAAILFIFGKKPEAA